MFTAHYSFMWAARVVDELCQTYPRGTDLLYEILGVDDGELTRMLAFGDPEWSDMRKLARFLQAYSGSAEKKFTRAAIVQDLRRNPYYRRKEKIISRLDKLEIWPTLNER